MFALFVSLAILVQPPATATPQPHHIPPFNQWHQWHGRTLSYVNGILPSPVVVVTSPNTVYATVSPSGVILQTYRLVPVVAEPVVVTPSVVVPETVYSTRGWFRWRR